MAGFVLTLCMQAQEKDFPNPVYPFGAVYFRKSNPPEQDWERDHKTAARMGLNIFRHWFMWASVENSPGKYDWRDYDRMVELEAQNHIKVVIAEIVNGAPEWMWDKYPRARRIDSTGEEAYPSVSGSSATGSAPMCLDNDDVRREAEKFLTALVERYRGNSATYGYDVWNEGSMQECYCPSTQAKFREWLKAKYGTIEALGRAWHRYSLADWQFVHPPRGGGYPDSLDWLAFRRDNAIELLKWRTKLIRRLDQRNKITAHSTGTFTEIEWRTAADVDSYGYTWVASRHTNDPWMQFHAVDLVRAASRGKPFWHAEATGGPLWLQPQVLNRPLEDGRSSDDKDVRVWSLIDMAAGASGIFFTRWRPLLDGPLFGAFGPMGMDGSTTPRAEMAGKLAGWTNGHAEIWKSKPVKGDVGIVFIQEADDFNSVQSSAAGGGGRGGRGAAGGGGMAAGAYVQSLQGAYQAFFDSNIQADFVGIDDIGQYPMIYVAFPEMLKKATADKIRDYVAKGGKLVSEGCPGYFGDGGTVGAVQPNLGLDQLFGAREDYVQFTPDILDKLTLKVKDKQIGGGYFLQEYRLAGGQAAGNYSNGHIAAVENTTGSGKTLLIGTFPAGSYYRNHSPATREFFAGLLAWAGVKPLLQVNDALVKARLHKGAGGTYLWVVNPTRTARTVKIVLPDKFQRATDLWQESNRPAVNGDLLTTTIEDRNAAVLKLE
jgi:beta-galactosidase